MAPTANSQGSEPLSTYSMLRRSVLKTAGNMGVLSIVGMPVFAQPVSADIPGVTIDYKSCHVVFVTNASDIDAIAVYYADRSGARQAVYEIDPTTTNPRGDDPLVIEYDPSRDRTQIQLAEPRGALACVIADSGSERTTRSNPIERCAIEGFNAAPTASFDVSANPIVGEPVTFTSTATDPDTPERLYYEWDLDGDGTYETSGQTATATYSSPGDKAIHHRVTDDCGASHTATETITVVPAELFAQITKLTASDGEAGDQFGISVSVDGDTALVGAQWEDEKGTRAGAAYVFE